jgi:hypothetical protein
MRLATEEESKVYWEKAEVWFKDAPAGDMFNDCRSVAGRSVAEYIANQDGITLYKHAAAKD